MGRAPLPSVEVLVIIFRLGVHKCVVQEFPALAPPDSALGCPERLEMKKVAVPAATARRPWETHCKRDEVCSVITAKDSH